ncbi:hypothetical protein SGCOL_001879 [Colletotrichum sp. CLE4]
MGSRGEYSVPQEAEAVFQHGILNNPLMKDLPNDLKSLSQHVKFEGSSKPSVPINWRFAESISALKALEATMLNRLILKKYNTEPTDVTINTDHASLFYFSPLIAQLIGKDGKFTPMALMNFVPEAMKMFPETDKHRTAASLHRALVTNIHKTKDGRYYQLHGGINPDPILKALGLPEDGPADDTYESVYERTQKVIAEMDSKDLDALLNDKTRQSGTVALSSDEYFASEHGKANSNVGLYEIAKEDGSKQPASWWPENSSLPSLAKRPLAGLKIVDLTRIIAAPLISRELAEMGASVMRVTSDKITDMSSLHQDLNWGKWNCHLDLTKDGDKEKLRELIREADVVVDGYRPGAMERHGFGRKEIQELVKDRQRGIIHVRENCYGWHGPWQGRGGWQQISDAAIKCCGVSLEYGKAMGLDEAVTPVFPNSDYCAGVCGSTAVLDALMKRAEEGGSYGVDIALNYYSQWLVRSCGTYPEPIWREVWERHGSPVFRHFHTMAHNVPVMSKLLQEYDAQILFKPEFFEMRTSKAVDGTFWVVKPVLQYGNNAIEMRYNVGTRGNGVDEPVWPEDLSAEVVGK